MGELIPFPKPKIVLTAEESLEYNEIKAAIERATTFREYRHLKKRVKEFMERVEERLKDEQQ